METVYEILLCAKDEEGNRKKAGDIIDIKTYPWNWGKIERRKYLVVLGVNLSLSDIENLTAPAMEITDPVLADPKEPLSYKPGEIRIITKRRYNIPLEDIKKYWSPNIDLDRVQDVEDEYQPVKDAFDVIDFSEKVGICYDKMRTAFKYKAKRSML
jgi:hypothetical protein